MKKFYPVLPDFPAAPLQKIRNFSFLLGPFLLLMVFSLSGCSETIIAVNGEKVKKKTFEQELRDRELMHEGKPVHVSPELMKKSAIAAIINRVIILQEARKAGITVSGEEIERKLSEFRGRFGTEQDFRAYLDKKLMSEKDLKKKIAEGLITDKFYDLIYNGISVSDDQVRRHYQNENWKTLGPRKMLIGYIETPSRNTALRIEEGIKKTYFDGVFNKLASEEQPGIKVRKPFWIYPDKYDPEFAKELKKIITGSYGGPVRIRDRWYFIRLFRCDVEMPGFEAVREKLRGELKVTMARQELQRRIEDALAKSNIKVYSERLDRIS